MKTQTTLFIAVVLVAGCHQESVSQLQWERDKKWSYDHATTPDERTLLDFNYRLMSARDEEKAVKTFSIADGVDQFEAWFLANQYRLFTHGICGMVGLPQKKDGKWVVSLAVGARAVECPPIIIDSKTGRLEHEGFPPIENSEAWLRNPKIPNQSLLPTPMSVTPPAGQEPRQP